MKRREFIMLLGGAAVAWNAPKFVRLPPAARSSSVQEHGRPQLNHS
jgi:hypothetical protein